MERGRMRGWMLWRVMPLLISGARAALSSTPRLFQHALRRVYNSFPRAHAQSAAANEQEGLALTLTNRSPQSSPRTNRGREQEEARDVRRNQWEMRGERGRGEGVTYAQACARSFSAWFFFCCVWARGRNFSKGEGRESPRARTTPEPVQTGRGEVWFGLVWIPTPVSLMLRVETFFFFKRTVERRNPPPRGGGEWARLQAHPHSFV